MSNNEKSTSFVDSTHRVKWDITKEEFDNCVFLKRIVSPVYAIDINGEKSKWYLSMLLKCKCKEENKNHIFVSLRINADKVYKVKWEFGIKTQDGYWPRDAFKNYYSRKSLFDHKYFGNGSDRGVKQGRKGWGYCLCTNEEFKKYFVNNKVTVEAFFVIYAEGDKHLNHMEVADDFVAKVRSMSSFESLSDFTIISASGDHRFPCHRVLLAATSKYFETLFRNEPTKKETTMEEPSEIVEAMLEFMYKGLILNDIDEKALDLILISDKFDLDLLTMACETSLVNNLSPDNAVEALITIDKLKHVSKLEHRKKVLAFIKTNVNLISKTKDWDTFVKTYPELITEIMLLK